MLKTAWIIKQRTKRLEQVHYLPVKVAIWAMKHFYLQCFEKEVSTKKFTWTYLGNMNTILSNIMVQIFHLIVSYYMKTLHIFNDGLLFKHYVPAKWIINSDIYIFRNLLRSYFTSTFKNSFQGNELVKEYHVDKIHWNWTLLGFNACYEITKQILAFNIHVLDQRTPFIHLSK